MKKNVLAENPLEMMFGGSARPVVRSQSAEPEELPTNGGASVVAIDAKAARSSGHAARPAATAEAAPESAPVARTSEKSEPSTGLVPTDMHSPAADETAPRSRSGRGSNRIGTLQQPYLRQKDGVETRQASTTLPVEILRKLGHAAVDKRTKVSELIRAAVEQYLEREGY